MKQIKRKDDIDVYVEKTYNQILYEIQNIYELTPAEESYFLLHLTQRLKMEEVKKYER